MKTRTIFLISMLLTAAFLFFLPGRSIAGSEEGGKGTVSIYASQGLHSLAANWAEAYNRTHPGQEVTMGTANSGQLGFVTGKDIATSKPEPGWQAIVGRSVVVPVISSSNPWFAELVKSGITKEAIAASMSGANNLTWGTLLKKDLSQPVHYYITTDPQTASLVAAWIPGFGENSGLVKAVTKEEFTALVQKDPFAIGFCNLNDVLTGSNGTLAENISLMPIDKNGNGRLDPMEEIYGSLEAFNRGVWIGKYPTALTGDIFCISAAQPEDINAMAFLAWVLNEGQSMLPPNGFSDLVMNERQSQLDKLYNAPITAVPVLRTGNYPNYLLIGLFAVIAGIFLLEVFGRRMRRSRAVARPEAASGIIADEAPGGLYYDKTHTWVYMEQDGLVTAGIDGFLSQLTGPFTRVEMKKPGDRVTKGEPFVTVIQQGKKLVLYSPVSGIVREQNPQLAAQASLVYSSPYSKGWVYRIEPTNWLREIQFLSLVEKYRSWIETEVARLKDFLAFKMNEDNFRYSQVVLQDGGQLKESLLAEFGPEVWEDFQARFLYSVK